MSATIFPPSGPLDWTNPCVRSTWSALAPAVLVAAYVTLEVLKPAFFKGFSSPLSPFLTFKEAEEYDADEPFTGEGIDSDEKPPLWLTFVLSMIAVLETGAWLAAGTYMLVVGYGDIGDAWRAFLVALTWLYAVIMPLVHPKASPMYDQFVLYLVHFVGGALRLGGAFFDHQVYDDPLPPSPVLVAYVLNLVAVVLLLVIVFSRPFTLPFKRGFVSPEEYASLWGWASFNWIQPLITRGTSTTLNEDDVSELSVTMRARPVFRKFATLGQASLTWRIWNANSQDIILDFVGTFVSMFFNYLGPYFLKCIIEAIDMGTPAAHTQAHLFALLMFSAQVFKSVADVQHLWFGRRAAIRIRAELMSAIYDKALKRRDFSGVVNKDRKDRKAKANDPKAGADVGKIVNLMAGDATRIAKLVGGIYILIGAPFEIIIACTFLYQLLGWSAFAGFLVLLLLGWPLNSLIARRAIRIQRGMLVARDTRMSVLNELIGAVKFIKFFAWEDRWIVRALDARKKELAWLVESRINSIFLQALWTTAPILVSVISFLICVVQGNELTVSTAFTAITLFNMIRMPLNVIPTWIMQILQMRIALQRIETFLNEEEVDEQVSTIKRASMYPSAPSHIEFGLRNASFKWNAVEEKEKHIGKDKKSAEAKTNGDNSTDNNSDRDVEAAVADAEASSMLDTDHKFELRDISVVFPEGELSVIIGPTASGKTALLLALLGEMTLLPGGHILISKEPFNIDEHGLAHTISYAAQTPWLQHQSMRENILFGNPFDAARYSAVIESCALRPDLAILEDGDETEIGARGVNLSGGQKARVALARAVYARTKYVLLDDPLSAVDSHTARFLYERLFLGPLMKNRTVILVTHHVELVLPGTYYLVRMLDGHIDVQGPVKELRASGALDSIAFESAFEEEVLRDKEELAAEGADDMKEPENEGEASNHSPTTIDASVKDKAKKPRKFVTDEEREAGRVKWSIYKAYLKASSYWTWVILAFLIILTQGLTFTEKYWIKVWGEAYGKGTATPLTHIYPSNTAIEQQALFSDVVSRQYSSHPHHDFATLGLEGHLPSAQEKPLFYVGMYALIGLMTVLVSITSVATTYTGALRASRLLFEQLLVGVVRATMRWHDVTPTGRMLNRFSKDIETVDSTLASSLQSFNSSLASFFSSLIVVIAVFPPFVFPAAFIGYFYYKLAIGYLNTGRDLRRMEATARSPIFSGFGELLEGIVTVRAFSAESRFMNGLYKKVDLMLGIWYCFWATNRWLLLRFDCLGALGVFTTTMFALSVDPTKKAGWAGWAALCITSAMAFTNSVYWACRSWTQLELDLNSVERVVEYLDLPQEPPAVVTDSRPPAHWPSSTSPNAEKLLEVKGLEVRYAPDLPAVLHGVSFSLKACERIGLLGRTGSGKSTLAMSILRFIDPAKGQILIDGIDITTIGVRDLRERLTFIPQDATLFSGTLRDNLDPFGDYNDLECLDALHRVQMLTESSCTSVRSTRAPSVREETAVEPAETPGSGLDTPFRMPSEASTIADVDTAANKNVDARATKISLDTKVSAGGLNFSAGQRQLIAMARALLRQSVVIILDEATSSIDFATDAKIQKTIRQEFGGSLLLTIAHRLRTVIDYDRLIVLDAGRVAEFDTPYNLLRREGGIFREMCLKSGSFGELEEAARAKDAMGGAN